MKLLYLLIILLVLSVGFVSCESKINGNVALTNADNYTNLLIKNSNSYDYRVIDCSGKDSDNDGYVSCTLNKTNRKTNEERLETIDCAYSFIPGSNATCKIKNTVTIQGQ